ncbi:MAG: family N-acetyltransferase [Mucilaginibacter sp.]|nr:family N-acetyltransferase [Mucilaginibacter sp.]
MQIILQIPHLIVREFVPDDEQLHINLYTDERVTKYVQRTEEETRANFSKALLEYKEGSGLGRWGIFNPADNDFIGVCILKPADSDPEKIELGYVLSYNYWGRGLATELTKALIAYGFKQKGITKICACTDPENHASQNVLLKAGFKRQGNVFWHKKKLYFFVVRR